MATPVITIVDPSPIPVDRSTMHVYGDRFETGCEVLFLDPSNVAEIEAVTATFVNAGHLIAGFNFVQADAPAGFYVRVRNPGPATSNIVLVAWEAVTPPPPEPPAPLIDADLDALRASLGAVSPVANALLNRSLVASRSWVRERVQSCTYDTPEVQEAIVLLASRLYKRRQSPEGVAGWGDLGIVRIIASDPDIERLLEHHLDQWKVGIA